MYIYTIVTPFLHLVSPVISRPKWRQHKSGRWMWEVQVLKVHPFL